MGKCVNVKCEYYFWANNAFSTYDKGSYHLCFCLYIFRRLIVARSLMLFPPAVFTRSVK